MLDQLSKVQIESPADQIARQLKDLISDGKLPVGSKLPSERTLSERFNVGRGYVREAIRKLEFYGVLRTSPQRGTYVQGDGVAALSGLISDVLSFEGHEFRSLMEARLTLERESAAFAAQRRSDDDIVELSGLLGRYEQKVRRGDPAIEEDLLFHLKIAEASGNTVLRTLMGIVAPDLVSKYRDLKVCDERAVAIALDEHQTILDHIVARDADAAARAMEAHLGQVLSQRF